MCSGRKKEVIDEEKQYMWEKQQEILRARREGRSLEGVKERREKARQAVRDSVPLVLSHNRPGCACWALVLVFRLWLLLVGFCFV